MRQEVFREEKHQAIAALLRRCKRVGIGQGSSQPA